MNDVATAMAKLSGIRNATVALLHEDVSQGRGPARLAQQFKPEVTGHYFTGMAQQLGALQDMLPNLYGDFQKSPTEPQMQMMAPSPNEPAPMYYSRPQLVRLVRDIDQIFEIRANSKLEQPAQAREIHRRVFITHGRSNDWREVQAYIEKDVKLNTMELAQEPNLGMTIIEKLLDGAERCDSAVIVMTGDDIDAHGQARSRENVMHEIGFFQGKYGRSNVCLLHEDGVSIPTNLSGVVYIPYPRGTVGAGFHVLARELKAIYER